MSTAAAVSMARPASWSVVCDFDGTISREDVTDSLLLRFARPGWQELESAWQAGHIGSADCMAAQVALLDCSAHQLDAHVAGLAIDPGFKPFVEAVHRAGASLTIASDGLDRVILAMLARQGLAHLPVRASRLVQAGARRWSLEFPNARGGCESASATCKCAGLRSGASGPTLLVGDGVSDFCAAAEADLTFAKSQLLDHCVARALPHRAIRDFADALLAWRGLVEGGATEAAAMADGDTA